MQKQFNRFGWYKPHHIFFKKEFNTFLESTIQPITKMTENFLSNEKIESASDVYNSCHILAIVT